MTKKRAIYIGMAALITFAIVLIFTLKPFKTEASAAETSTTEETEAYPDISGYTYQNNSNPPIKIGTQYYTHSETEGYNRITFGLAFNGAGSWNIKLYFTTEPTNTNVSQENSFAYYETTVNTAITSISWFIPDLGIIQEGSGEVLQFVTGYFYVLVRSTVTAGSASPAYFSYKLESESLKDFTTGYENGYSVGYQNGESTGYQNGYNTGFTDGKADGISEGLAQQNSFLSLTTAVVDAPVKVFTDLFDIEILGFNLKNVAIGLLGAALIIALIRKFAKG